MPTLNSVKIQITNVLDFLAKQEIAVYCNYPMISGRRVSWGQYETGHLSSSKWATVDQYLDVIRSGQYSAILYDGSLLQLSCDVEDGWITWHRLGYFPCPFRIEPGELILSHAFDEVIESHVNDPGSPVLLRSPIRIDFDTTSVWEGHPAAHLTLNSNDCRIGCVAPMDVFSFVDFIFRQFYPAVHARFHDWFIAGSLRRVGERTLGDGDSELPHLCWAVNLPSVSMNAADQP